MSNRPGDVLSSLCSDAQKLIIAAPYIKASALFRVLSDISSTASLICITRWNPQDLVVGASDLECRTIINQLGGSFRLRQSLHAKYYHIDDVVLVGSANLTSSAMGWSPQSNLEILCRPGDDFDADSFERSLLDESREISDDEFEYWKALTKDISQMSSTIASTRPQLRSWRPATRDPKNLELVYQGREDDIASLDELRAARSDIQILLIPPGLTSEQIRMWASACLLAVPFANTVIQLQDMEPPSAARSLAETYGLGVIDARRDMETVLNWFRFLAPDILRGSS